MIIQKIKEADQTLLEILKKMPPDDLRLTFNRGRSGK
jgi:hypothetical protein